MRKVCRYLTTMLALTASASCISVPEGSEDGRVDGKTVRLTVMTRADGVSAEQGDAIEDMHVWAFACDADGNVLKDEPDAYGYMYFADEDGLAQDFGSGSITLDFSNADLLERYYMFIAVVNASHFGYVYSGGEDEGSAYTDIYFDEATTFSELSSANFDGYSSLEGGFSFRWRSARNISMTMETQAHTILHHQFRMMTCNTNTSAPAFCSRIRTAGPTFLPSRQKNSPSVLKMQIRTASDIIWQSLTDTHI